MKKILLSVAIALTTMGCANAQKTEFSKESLSTILLSIDDSEVEFQSILSKHKGKVTVIEIWASWCSDCVKAMPKLKELQQNNPEIDYVFISMDKEDDKWKAGVEKYALVGDHYWSMDGMKGDFAASLDVDWIPRYIILDKTGKIITYRAIETDFETINSTLKKLTE